jgi:DNA-binding winged helix-turn-helix (wHTH) protein/TolB-like protein
VVRFGVFQFSAASRELFRDGTPVRLQTQPAKVLAALVARAGQVVSREDLQREVWGGDTHVDFERGLNFCIAQVRTALGDSANSPRYIETVPTQGYRFIAPVRDEPSANQVETPEVVVDSIVVDASRQSPAPRLFAWSGRLLLPVGVLLVGILTWTQWTPSSSAVIPTVVVIPFYNETGRPELDATARAVGDALVARLASPQYSGTVSVIGNAPSLRNPFARQDVQQIGRTLGASHLVIGQLQSDGARLRLLAHLIRVEDMKHLWAGPFEDERFLFDAQSRTAEAIASTVSGTVHNAKR